MPICTLKPVALRPPAFGWVKKILNYIQPLKTAEKFFSAWERAENLAEISGLLHGLAELINEIGLAMAHMELELTLNHKPLDLDRYHQLNQDLCDLLMFLSVLATWSQNQKWPDSGHLLFKRCRALPLLVALGAKPPDSFGKIRGLATTLWYKIVLRDFSLTRFDMTSAPTRIIISHFAYYSGNIPCEHLEHFFSIFESILSNCWAWDETQKQQRRGSVEVSEPFWQDDPTIYEPLILAFAKTNTLHFLLYEKYKPLIPAWVKICSKFHQAEMVWDEAKPGNKADFLSQSQALIDSVGESVSLSYLRRLIQICY